MYYNETFFDIISNSPRPILYVADYNNLLCGSMICYFRLIYVVCNSIKHTQSEVKIVLPTYCQRETACAARITVLLLSHARR